MRRLSLIAMAAAAAAVAGLTVPANGATAAPSRALTPAVGGAASSSPVVQWLPGTDGTATALVHYPNGFTARITHRTGKPAVRADARVADVRSAPQPTARPALTAADVPAADRTRISGRVFDTDHHPLADVRIRGYASQMPFATTTDADGHYLLVLAPGSYYLYVDGRNASGGVSDTTGYVGTAENVQLVAGQHLIRNARLRPGAELTVRATDRAGRPLAGAVPYLAPVAPYVQTQTGSGGGGISFVTEDQTGPDGTFTYRGLSSDAAFVCFSAYGVAISGGVHDNEGYRDHCSRRPVALAPQTSTAFPAVRLASGSGGALRGVVTGVGGRPLAGVEVELERGLHFGGDAVTGADGSFKIEGIHPAAYRVCAQPGGLSDPSQFGYARRCLPAKVDVRRDHLATADMRLHRGGAVTGTVIGPGGSPVPDAVVFSRGRGEQLAVAITDGQGRYRLTGLSSGEYRVCVRAINAVDPDSPTGDRPRCYGDGEKVAVRPRVTSNGIDVQLQRGGAVVGRVVDSDGAGIGNVDVEVEDLSGNFFGADGTTDADGNYRITGLPAGRYDACFFDFGAEFVFYGSCAGGEVNVRIGQSTELDQTLGTSGPHGTIVISVRDEQGRPVQGVDAAVFKRCGKRNPFECESAPLFGHPGRAKIVDSQVVDTAGRVRSDRKPGSYAVCLFAYYGLTADGAPSGGYTDRCAGRGFTVTVSADATTHLHLILHPGGRVIGRVTDRSGQPVAHALVKVSHSAVTNYAEQFAEVGLFDQPSPLADSLSRKDGSYSITGVRPGGQQLCVQAPRGDEFLDGCADEKVKVAATATTRAPRFTLRRAGAISGVVRNRAGRPLRDVEVDVRSSARHLVGYTFVDRNKLGHYRVGKLPAGHFVVCFLVYRYDPQCYSQVPWNIKSPRLPKGAVRVAVRSGRTTTGIDAVLHRSN